MFVVSPLATHGASVACHAPQAAKTQTIASSLWCVAGFGDEKPAARRALHIFAPQVRQTRRVFFVVYGIAKHFFNEALGFLEESDDTFSVCRVQHALDTVWTMHNAPKSVVVGKTWQQVVLVKRCQARVFRRLAAVAPCINVHPAVHTHRNSTGVVGVVTVFFGVHEFADAPLCFLNVHKRNVAGRHNQALHQLSYHHWQGVSLADLANGDVGLRLVAENVLKVRIEQHSDLGSLATRFFARPL